jgi:circadian clock protein KaiC
MHAMNEEQQVILHLHELLAYLGQQGVTSIMLLTLHGVVGPTMTSSVDVSFLADNVLLFRYFEHMGEVRQAISVFKRRAGPHERTIRELTISNNGLKIGEPLRKFRGVLTGSPVSDGQEMKDSDAARR